jgi:hypothetical protein
MTQTNSNLKNTLNQFDQTLQNINKSLETINKSLEIQQYTLLAHQDFINNESKAIEREINEKLDRFLSLKYPGYRIINILNDFPDMEFFYFPRTNKKLTQFDGLFIATNDDNYNPSYNTPENYIYNKPNGKKYILIVVEAKHALTSANFNKKLNLLTKVQECFDISRQIHQGLFQNVNELHKQFLFRNRVFQFYNLDPEIHWIIGGPYIEPFAADFIRRYGVQLWKRPQPIKLSDELTIEQKFPIKTSLILPQGNRYSIGDVEDNYKLHNPIPIGGKIKTSKNR